MRNPQSNKIGIFDSGVGGLTVLRQLYRQLPHESIIYFADTDRLPYGNRSAEEILKFVREILTWMNQQKVKMVIMACNTSSALALETVRSEFDFPILASEDAKKNVELPSIAFSLKLFDNSKARFNDSSELR